MSYHSSVHSKARRALAALVLTALVSVAPAQSFSLWDFLVNLLVSTEAGVRIDDNGLA